jgi:hypothetical protein
MSELPDRVRRAFRDHDAFEPVATDDDSETATYRATSTPFEGVVDAEPVDGGRTYFAVTVRVPMLDEVTEDAVAPVVEEGWFETLELRISNVGGIFEGDHDVAPETRETAHEGTRVAEVRADLTDIDPRRGVNDAAAIVDFVEGTFVQGIIPGYEYGEPVTSIISQARQAGGSSP